MGKAEGSRMSGTLLDLALKMPTLLEHSAVGNGSSFLQTKQVCGLPVPDLNICSHREGESATSHSLSLSKGRPCCLVLVSLRILSSQREVHRSHGDVIEVSRFAFGEIPPQKLMCSSHRAAPDLRLLVFHTLDKITQACASSATAIFAAGPCPILNITTPFTAHCEWHFHSHSYNNEIS